MSILQPLDAAALMENGHLTPVDSFGMQRVRKNHLYRDHNRISTPAAMEESDLFVAIPYILISEATLRYVGYRPEIAAMMWTSWTNDGGWRPEGVDREIDDFTNRLLAGAFEEFVWAHAEAAGSSVEAESDSPMEKWNECLHACGLNDETCQAIMDEDFENIRQTQDCLFWVLDTIQMRYRGLVEVQSFSRRRELALQREQDRQHEVGPSL